MVMLVPKLNKFYSKMDNQHHRRQDKALSASLQLFIADVSKCVHQVFVKMPKPDAVSLEWFQLWLEVLPIVNKAFGRLVVGIDFPEGKWEDGSLEEYLNYTLDLLGFLNSINSAISHLSQARLSLSHAVSLVENGSSCSTKGHLKTIQSVAFRKDWKEGVNANGKERIGSSKEEIIRQALMLMKSIGFWVCGIVLSGLCGDDQPYLEMRKLAGGANSLLMSLPLTASTGVMQNGCVLEEVRELNGSVASLVDALIVGRGSDEAKVLGKRLEGFEKLLDGLRKEVDMIFSNVLAGRNELLDILKGQE